MKNYFILVSKFKKGDLSEEQLEEWLKNNSYPIDE